MFDDAQEQRTADRAAIKENTARLASAYSNYESTGQGSIEFARRTDFGLTFIERPFVSYGAVIDLDELGDLLDIAGGEDTPMPIVTGMVTEFDIDERGFYVGAWVGARVYFPTTDGVPVDAKVVCEHHFTFQAVAIKDVPLDVLD
jgi:hypothetical protein